MEINKLSKKNKEKLETFKSMTAISLDKIAIDILRANKWNVNVIIKSGGV